MAPKQKAEIETDDDDFVEEEEAPIPISAGQSQSLNLTQALELTKHLDKNGACKGSCCDFDFRRLTASAARRWTLSP